MTRPEDTMPALAAALGMEPHPEGGWFVRTWAAGPTVATPNGTRPTATLIHFLLSPGEVSAWHAVVSDEVWLWHGPGELALQLGGNGEEPDADGPVHVLGPAADGGRRPSRWSFLPEPGSAPCQARLTSWSAVWSPLASTMPTGDSSTDEMSGWREWSSRQGSTNSLLSIQPNRANRVWSIESKGFTGP